MNKPEIKKYRKLTNLEVLQLHHDLKSLKAVPGIKLNFAIARTLQSLKPLVEAYDQEKLIPKSKDFLQFEEEIKDGYTALASEGGKKPKTKIVQSPAGEYETLDFDINGERAQELRTNLKKKFEKALDDRTHQVTDYNNWLNQECEDEYRVFMVRLSEMPDSNLENYKQLWDICGVMVMEEATETC